MKHSISFLILLGLLTGGVAFAQEADEAELEAIEQAESVSTADLGIENPGLLPTSPFYFFKEWGRGVQSFFTFNKVKKAELELRFSNEKAAELKAVEEQRPDDERAIDRALSNFQGSQERLKVRLEKMQETSENPNVDRLLDKVAEKSVLHEKLLEEVKARHEDKEAVRKTAESAKAKIVGVVQGLAGLDTPEKFTDRLKEALENTPGSAFKHIRSVEFIDNVQEKLTEEVKTRLENVREEFTERVKEKIEIESEDGEKLKAILERIPGDSGRRAVVLEELRIKVSDRAANALGQAQDALEEKISNAADRKETAAEQIRRAGEILGKAQEKARQAGELRESVKTLLQQAERHLVSAKQAFEEENYGEAFGRARAAEVAARNALRALEGGEDSPAILERVKEKAQERIKLIEPIAPRPSEPADNTLCTQEYKPVCGVDGKTYSNRCVAEQQNRVRVAQEGECYGVSNGLRYKAEEEGPLDFGNILQKITPQFLGPKGENAGGTPEE